MHYYTFNIGDYASHTKGLDLLEDLAYRRILDEYYLGDGPLKGSHELIARQIGMRGHEDCVLFVLQQFFDQTDNGWVNSRAEREIDAYKSKREKASNAGRASAERRFNERSTDVQQTFNQPITNNQEPINNKEEKPKRRQAAPSVQKPDDVGDQTWTDYLSIRKAKRSPLTETALKSISREAESIGWSLEQALRECVSRGWQGFKGEWVDKSKSTALTFAERDELAKRKRWEEMTGRQWPDQKQTGWVQGASVELLK